MKNKTKCAIQSESQQKQIHEKAINSTSTFSKQISSTLLPWLLIILSSTIVAPSLVAIVTSSCGEGKLQIKFWEFEYQLNKKGDCSIPDRPEK
ncbi:hypothetical protein [Mastigocoleus testarum]|nr:hypothetical protein [Mastigocoleus testarum]